MSYFKGCRETGTYCTQSGWANSIPGLLDTECNLQILWLDLWSEHLRWSKKPFTSSSNFCLEACGNKRWGERSNAPPPSHQHPISQLIRGYLKTTSNRYSPPRCFLYGWTALLKLNWHLCRPISSRDGREIKFEKSKRKGKYIWSIE